MREHLAFSPVIALEPRDLDVIETDAADVNPEVIDSFGFCIV